MAAHEGNACRASECDCRQPKPVRIGHSKREQDNDQGQMGRNLRPAHAKVRHLDQDYCELFRVTRFGTTLVKYVAFCMGCIHKKTARLRTWIRTISEKVINSFLSTKLLSWVRESRRTVSATPGTHQRVTEQVDLKHRRRSSCRGGTNHLRPESCRQAPRLNPR